MSGAELKLWAPKDEMGRQKLASNLGITLNTLYSWFRSAALKPVNVLALARLGCPKAVEETEHFARRAGFGR